MKLTKSLTAVVAALPVSWALIGCGGGGGATKPAPPSAPKVDAGPAKDDGGKAEDKPAAGDAKETTEAAAAPAGWGTIKGKVVLDGDVPERKLINKKGDMAVKDFAICAAEDVLGDELVVNKDNKGIQWALLYVAGKPVVHDDLKEPEGTVEFGQKNCVFKPHVMCVRQGQKLKITSDDPVGHNTNIKPWRGEPVNPLVPAAPEGGKSEMDGPDLKVQPRPFPINCDIHKWMSAYMMVFDHPYFAVTGEDGSFEIAKVPAGTLKLVSWQESIGYGEGGNKGQDVEVKPDSVTEITITLKAK